MFQTLLNLTARKEVTTYVKFVNLQCYKLSDSRDDDTLKGKTEKADLFSH